MYANTYAMYVWIYVNVWMCVMYVCLCVRCMTMYDKCLQLAKWKCKTSLAREILAVQDTVTSLDMRNLRMLGSSELGMSFKDTKYAFICPPSSFVKATGLTFRSLGCSPMMATNSLSMRTATSKYTELPRLCQCHMAWTCDTSDIRVFQLACLYYCITILNMIYIHIYM